MAYLTENQLRVMKMIHDASKSEVNCMAPFLQLGIGDYVLYLPLGFDADTKQELELLVKGRLIEKMQGRELYRITYEGRVALGKHAPYELPTLSAAPDT